METEVPGDVTQHSEEQHLAAQEAAARVARPRRRRRWWVLRWGCLGLLLFVCGSISLLAIALSAGPVTLGMPGGSELKLGSNDTVLSNFSFQEGTTYYFDLSGNGVRNIIELNYLQASRSLELVVHHSTKQEQSEDHLLTMKLP
jgi:hypothetical protein